jgi:hypothetical protein
MPPTSRIVERRKKADIKQREPKKKARRWVVKVCHSCSILFSSFRKLLVRYEKLARSLSLLAHKLLAATIDDARDQPAGLVHGAEVVCCVPTKRSRLNPHIEKFPELATMDNAFKLCDIASSSSLQGAADESHASAQSPQRGRASLRAVLSEPVLFAYRTAPR